MKPFLTMLGRLLANVTGRAPLPDGVPAPGLAWPHAVPSANDAMRLVSPRRVYFYRLPGGRLARIRGEDLMLYCRDIAIVLANQGKPADDVTIRASRRVLDAALGAAKTPSRL